MSLSAADVQAIFGRALELEPTERAYYLASECGDNAALRADVESLLLAYDRAENFLETAGSSRDPVANPMPVHEGVGSLIGPYKLLQQIGEGGFGVVYMAQQAEPLKRCVALKIIKPGMDSRQTIARFEVERQALAMMDHVNVARVLDAGTSEAGRPYFVMELVKGVPITKFCDDRQFTIRQRLDVFIRVCEGVQHAHHKGVIHRDLKPSNILVAEYDDRPVPKVIDFGVAKALNQQLTEKTMFTQFGQLVGTLNYMSPEQAKLNQLDVDTRSDIYSLGVVLYELLTGSTPIDQRRLQSAPFDEVLKIIAEEEAPTPSTRLSKQDTLPEIAASRDVEPTKLIGVLRGELDWVVMKALEKDRGCRYQTAMALAEDIQRHLNDQPIEARRPSTLGRLRKFIRRKRVPVVLASCAVVALAVATTFAVLAYLGNLHAEIATARQRDQQRVREIDIPQLRRLLDASQLIAAYRLAEKIQNVLPDDPVMKELTRGLTAVGTIRSEPPGAKVSVRDWNSPDGSWLEIGQTPLANVSLPRGELRWRFEKAGYLTRELQQPFPGIGPVSLWKKAEVPEEMVLIAPTRPTAEVATAFLIDRYEVTNRQFQRFINAGGYQQQQYWSHPFEENGVTLSWDEAMKRFVDPTGRPGPATWADGRFPQQEEDHPVSGISWYEAAAYARFVGKSLPTIHHWRCAASLERHIARSQFIVPLSNFAGQGTQPVGKSPGIGLYDVYDMAGNVTEWCFNATEERKRCFQGGAWDTPEYMFGAVDFDSPFARLPRYGFRCVKYLQEPSAEALLPKSNPRGRNFEAETLATPEEFAIYKRHFLYDRELPLNTKTVGTTDTDDYRHEVVRIDAAYDGEQFDVHLFLPRRGTRPHQTLVLFPDMGARQQARFADHYHRVYFFRCIIGIVERGWALCWPVYKGTFERALPDAQLFNKLVSGRDLYIKMSKDLSRTVDYLETRLDIDSAGLTYIGSSWGTYMGPVMVAVEPRLKAAVFIAGGSGATPLMPEVEPLQFAPHVQVPVLMINGKYDLWFPLDSSQMPLYRHLGSQDKVIRHFDSGHVTPSAETVDMVDEWLRQRFRSQ